MSAALRRNGEWLWLAFAIALIGALQLLASLSSRPEPPLSSRSAQKNGTLALYVWLERIGYRVQRADSPSLGFTAVSPPSGTVLLLRPDVDVPASEVQALLDWSARGGRVVIANDGHTTSAILRRLPIGVGPTFESTPQVVQPALLSPPVARLAGPTYASVDRARAGNSVPVIQSDYGPVLTMEATGAGMLSVLTAPSLLENDEVAKADNRRLALNLVGSPGSTVIFDEAPLSGGAPAPVSDWLTQTSWGAAFIIAAAALALYWWLGGLRLGPPVIPLQDRYRPAVEYVESVAGLLRRARRRAEVLSMYERELRRLRMERGLDLEKSNRDSASAGGEPLSQHLSDTDLVQRAASIVEAEQELRRRRV